MRGILIWKTEAYITTEHCTNWIVLHTISIIYTCEILSLDKGILYKFPKPEFE